MRLRCDGRRFEAALQELMTEPRAERRSGPLLACAPRHADIGDPPTAVRVPGIP